MTMTDPSPRRVLVVDDDEDIRENLRDILTDLGFEVETAGDAPSAFAILSRERFDVALLDLKMPGEDGLTLAKRIKGAASGVVSIIVTAYAGGASPEEIASSGAWRVLNKPIHLPTLLSLVGEASRQPTVLVIDDDRPLCENLWDILRERGYRVGLVHDVQALESCIHSTTPDVVLIDLRLPDGDGVAALRHLRARHPEVKSIVITGFPSELSNLVEDARMEGAEAVCFKPFDIPSLLSLVETLSG